MSSDPPDHPERIGRFKLLELLGTGGMGEVWLAEQSEPVHRRVALKIIKLGMDTRQVLARLEAERQALAVMDHPNIARFYDGGATETGRPYFVMELVQGTSITDYCDTNRLTTDERIRLFIDVCQAVQHAHHKGVVHRDLKPSNVLITVKDNKPVVKIIDFGIAKALGQDLTERTLVTQVGQMVGTPEYMSPEQAEMSGLDVDTRTDVYSLGVMLYELLVGALPFDLRARMDEVIRFVIRDTDVPRPSTRLTSLTDTQDSIAKFRRTTVDALKRELSSDLDWIILKAMEKDRTRRYETASGFALELERHLRHEPVLARPPTMRYRVGKFVKRHRLGVAASSAVVAALVVGLSLATLGMVRARRAERRAEQEAVAAQQVADFLVELFRVSSPSEARGNSITAREVLDRGAERIREELADQPEVQGRLMDIMGRVYMGLGLYGEARPLLEEATRVRRESLGSVHPELAEGLTYLAEYLILTGEAAAAVPLAEEAVAVSEAASGPGDPATARSRTILAWALQWLGRYDEAQANLDRALAIQEATLGSDDMETAHTLYRLGWQYRLLGDFEAARDRYQRAIPVVEKLRGDDEPLLAAYLSDLGVVESEVGNDSAATRHYLRALTIREKALGPDHPDVARTLNNLGILAWQARELDEAQAYYERSLSIQEKAFGDVSPSVSPVLNNLGLLYMATADYVLARDAFERALAIVEAAVGPEHVRVAGTLSNLGYLYRYVGDSASARPLLERALRIREASMGPDHLDLTYTLVNLGLMASDASDHQGALEYFHRHLRITEGALGSDHVRVGESLRHIIGEHIQLGDLESADTLLARWKRVDPGHTDQDFQEARILLGEGDRAGADSLFARWVESMAVENGAESAEFFHHRSRAAALMGDVEGAISSLHRALDLGYADPWVTRNREFQALFGDPRFEAIVEEIRARVGLAAVPAAL